MNAASGSLSFPTDKLEVVSVSKSGSIFSLWVQDPSFSNSSGTINFEGIILNPGFTGASGKLVTINFKAKSAGIANVSFSSGTVLANDGAGTAITSGLGKATITIKEKTTEKPAPPEKKEPPKEGLPTVTVTSSSHPDSNAWYGNSVANLHWSSGVSIKGVSVFVDQKPDTTPVAVSDGLFSDYATKPLGDSVWYFHARVQNSVGWGPATHYRLQIDTTAPKELSVMFIDEKQTFNFRPTVVLNASDLSGVDRYEIRIDDGEMLVVKMNDLDNGKYVLPAQEPGAHRLIVDAIDKAGNRASVSADFTIVALKAPIIDYYKSRLLESDILAVKGITDYPDASVVVWLESENEQIVSTKVRADAKGSFHYVHKGNLPIGVTRIWAQVGDEMIGVSGTSDKIVIVVKGVAWLAILGHEISMWWVLLVVLIIISVHAVILWRNKRFARRRKLKWRQ